MSNNYNTTLQSNNTDLQAILNTINELPEGGSGDITLQDKTITPTTSKQTVTADSGYDGLSKVTVNAIPSTYVKPTTTKAATTYTPTTSNQTIAAGTYCSGAQTIKGDANLVAGNIKSGTSIFGVAGSYEGSGGSGQIASGTFTSDGFMRTISISGLSFKPSNVVIEARRKVTVYAYENIIIIAKGDKLNSYISHDTNGSGYTNIGTADNVELTFSDDGFDLTAPNLFGKTTYYWTAIGG